METNKENDEYEVFDDAVTDLFVVLDKVLDTHERHNLNLTDIDNPVQIMLQSYIKTYDKTAPKDHIWYFNNIFKKHKSIIMKGPYRDDWIKKGNVVIQYGEDVGIKNNIKIHLSSIYNTACKLRDDIEESLEGLPDTAQTEEILYPIIIVHYLYKIFTEINTKKTDKKKLANFTKDTAREAGLRNGDSNNNNPLDSLMSSMSGIAKSMGIDMPEGKNMPSGDQLTSMMSNLVENPQTKSMLGNLMKDVKECDNIGDMAGKVVGALGNMAGDNPELGSMVENIGGMLGGGGNKERAEIEDENVYEVANTEEYVEEGEEYYEEEE